jgi:hypothetical protein
VVTPPSAITPGQITYTGGQLNLYTLPAGTNISAPGSVAGDIAGIEAGKLFLSENASIEDASGDTLIETFPADSTLANFAAASDFGFLDISGGDAAFAFNANTFAEAFDTGNGGFADKSFTNDVSTGGTGGFAVSGSGTFKANAVPEPAAALMSVFGLALLVCNPRHRAGTARKVAKG